MAIINDLPVMSTPASGDELPIERGTTVYKIDYNALAAAIIAQQALTGVKGNAESTDRTGNVNLTPANLGAVAASAIIDISHGGSGQTGVTGTAVTFGTTDTRFTTLSGGFYRWGKVVMLAFDVVCNLSETPLAVGGNLDFYVTNVPAPYHGINTPLYNGAGGLVAMLNTAGLVRIHNTHSAAFSSSSFSAAFAFTYITSE